MDSSVVNGVAAKVATVAAVTGGAIFAINYFFGADRAHKELQKQKVKFNKNNIPHYTIAQVKEYAGKAQRGELYRWGSNQYLPIQVHKHMVEKRMKAIYWSPARLVTDLYAEMKGANFPFDPRTFVLGPLSTLFSITTTLETDPRVRLWKELLGLNKDQIRYLHNYWIENSAEASSFFDWVEGEWSSSETQEQLLAKLSSSGVGEFVNKIN